ncbi:MAG: DUF488 domain-containing protein [Euryarchaeota archaeon]|nr:DUF488 domain-containing protein [Euryarchaeota archaeon]
MKLLLTCNAGIHAGLCWNDFLSLLRMHGIEVLVDVRRFPRSKNPEFVQERLKQHLEAAGMRYLHLAELGGYRRGGYLAYTRSREFREGIERLMELAAAHRVAVMCLEKQQRWCHRRYIAQALASRGVEVVELRA